LQNRRSIGNSVQYFSRFRNILVAQIGWILVSANLQWAAIGFWAEEKILGKDLQYVALSVECDSLGPFFTSDVDPKCEYYYGLLLIKAFRILGLNTENYLLFYYVLSVIFIIACTYIFWKITLSMSLLRTILAFFAAFGPHYLLLLHRGNIDTLIVSMCILGLSALKSNRKILVFIIIMLTTFFKFYTLPILLLFNLFSMRDPRLRLYHFITFMVTLEVFREVTNIDYAPLKNLSSSFGLLLFRDYYFRILSLHRFFLVVFIFMLISVTLFALYVAIKIQRITVPYLSKFEDQNFASYFILQHLFCYVFFINYDWRLVYLIFGLLMWSSIIITKTTHSILIAFALIATWTSSGFNSVAIASDFMYLGFLVFISLHVFQNLVIGYRERY